MAESFPERNGGTLKKQSLRYILKLCALNRKKYRYFFFGNPVSGSNCLACWACSFV